MAAPTAPTLASITAEGLKKAGYTSTSSTQYSTLLTRAQDEWMEEIKHDIFTYEKQLFSLQTAYVHVTTEGLDRYSMPTDHGSTESMVLLDGSSTGTFQAGSTTTTWVLGSSEAATAAGLTGKEILVYAGTAIRQIGRVTAYNATTKNATVSGCTVAPDSGDSYMILDTYYNLTVAPIKDYDAMGLQGDTGTPRNAYLTGDSDYGEFILRAVPYRSSSVPWGIRHRYYADLTTLDLASTTMSTCYRRWRNVFIQGVFAKALEAKSDGRALAETQRFYQMVSGLAIREKYGAEIPAGIQFGVGGA